MKPIPRPPAPRRAPRRMVRPLHARAAARQEEIEDYDGESEPSMKFSHALIVVLVLHILAVGGVFAFNTLKTAHVPKEKSKAAAVDKKEVQPEKAEAAPDTPPAVATKVDPKPAPAAAAAPAGPSHTVVAGDTLTKIASQYKTTVEAIEQANGLSAASTIRVGQVLKLPARAAAEAKPAPARDVPPVAKAPEQKPVAKSAAAVPAPAKPAPETAKAAAAPSPAPKPAASPAAAQAETRTEASGGTYTVAKGDNPYSIAKKLKVSYSELLKVNKIEDPTKLQIGQKLTIP